MIKRLKLTIKGVVQGVGFRPFIYSLAHKYSLGGYVLNDTRGVLIEVEGEKGAIDEFVSQIEPQAPPQACITDIQTVVLPLLGYDSFVIKESLAQVEKFVLISPDIATCEQCLQELMNPEDFRYHYPFINCTNCGPRFTIIKDIPYDREKTTMAKFVMCKVCAGEYHNPLNRRFHAQPNACPECGPKVSLLDNAGEVVKCSDVITEVVQLLKLGKIVAIKGLGGFHLACDAFNCQAVSNLRRRKYREDKPFALMAPSLEAVEEICEVDEPEMNLLLSTKRPIVLMRKRLGSKVAGDVAPRQRYLGVMLPYTPLHYLILRQSGLVLVMTSGNIADEPISYENEEALARLKNIADYFLVHNRDIHTRCDDSVTRVFNGEEMVVRRARGYVPQPVEVNTKFKQHILACGAELKNTFCLCRDNYAFLSHHIGDLQNMETLKAFEVGIEHFKRLFYIEPGLVAYDFHPEYLSTIYALALENMDKVGIQHHHAHIVSCMADNGLDLDQKVMGVAFDGTGYGEDGNIGGGEFLVADAGGYERVGHFKYVPLPGGEMAIREPWRMAAVHLYNIYGKDFYELDLPFVKQLDFGKWVVLENMIEKRLNCPLTSSAGRLFDAVSALLGIRLQMNYEGQAAVELEMVAESCCDEYGYEIKEQDGILVINPEPIIAGVVEDLVNKNDIPYISAKFHNTVAGVIVVVCQKLRGRLGLEDVVLSGGVFQNMFLLGRVCKLLKENGFKPYTHHRVPTNDGGISLGQAVIANAGYL